MGAISILWVTNLDILNGLIFHVKEMVGATNMQEDNGT